jgi:uncharacterized damage-inducible protein DinB
MERGVMSAAALRGQLRSLRALVEALSHDVYRSVLSRSSGSVGEHVRHCLDHARALLTGINTGELTYDARLRGTRIETDPGAAAIEIAMLCVALDRLDVLPGETPIRLRTIAQRGEAPVEVITTAGREIAFVIQHTIHHCALIAVLLERRDITVPASFGYAPSTPLPA